MLNLKLPMLIQFITITLGISIGVYFSFKSSQQHTLDHLENHSTLNHGFIDISSDSIIPVLEKVEITKDPVSGWNLHLVTKHFHFTPENINSEHIPGEGHAHLMINGEKVARVYSSWFHFPQQKNVITKLEVTLNANSHAILAYNNKPIAILLDKSEMITICEN